MVKPGLYYSFKTQSYWRVYEPIGNRIPMIKMVTGATETMQDINKFNEAVENGSFKYDANRSALINHYIQKDKNKKR